MNNTADKFGRQLKYLRISVTDRCNFRCRYCMPNNSFTYIEPSKILRYEDILFAAEVFAELGVNRLRVTGGEPLVRKGLIDFLAQLTKIDGINQVMLTTNASLLDKFAEGVFHAGVRRLNISLDSLRADRNKFITGADNFSQTLKGIDKAVATGFSPIKINTVVIKGFNDDELEDFCSYASVNHLIVRFIEFMPIGNSIDWGQDKIITGNDMLQSLAKFEPVALKKDENAGPAQNYLLNNGATIGIITPMSRHFCSECDKLRLTADGKIRPCLLSDKEVSLTEVIKDRDKQEAAKMIIEALNLKSIDHGVEAESHSPSFRRTMSKIGG